MRDFRLVLGVHLHTWFNGVKREGVKGYLKLALQVILYVAIAVGFGWGAYGLFNTVGDALKPYPQYLQPFLLNCLMSLGIATIVLMFMSTLNIVYQYIYESEDIAFLMSTPLSPRAIFGARFAESYFMCILSALPFGLGPMVSLGLSQGAGPEYYVVSTLAYLSLVALVLGLAAAGLVAVMRYVPGQRMKQLTMGVGLLVGLGIVFLSQFAAYKSDSFGAKQIASMGKSIAGLKLGDISLLPHSWLAHASVRALGQESTSYLVTLLPLVVAAIAAMAFVVWVAAGVYVAGWSSNQEVSRKKPSKRVRTIAQGTPSSPLHGPFWGLVRKEFKLSFREPILWYNFAVGAIVVVFMMMNLSNDSGGNGTMPEEFKRYFLVFMVLFGSSVGGSQLAGSALSREGSSWHLLRSFPVKPGVIFGAKAFASGLPSLIMAFVGVLTLYAVKPGETTPLPLYVSLPMAVVVIGVLTSLLIMSDVLAPNFTYKLTTGAKGKGNAAAGIKASVTSLGSMLYLAIMVGTFVFPTYYKEIGWFAGWSETVARSLAYAVFAVETVGVSILGYSVSVKRLGRLVTGA